ncbi:MULTISPECIES: type II toxin-antitoxin system RelE/ParE family toxin [unclassified Corynebacterium]|uniref:type II toxin-antitoxin system RelE family toxin n=1 Tax=unclassified Corynebacterium TaxID=2624378 RepID=UPI0029CA387B|nr:MULTISPECIES: type II toxin-antitoxin system RelE/ParE family toxin [unclassified Corynebacterium]WPF66336.1 type II toxin-antitoxin system RelE/ParE family toxin [Corynebacterium sp. 22KM0430]WPF68826.1 type II toxin-antitoxin system RelE/ParE family toxin [Corynebacterium sp. 21KM1197]
MRLTEDAIADLVRLRKKDPQIVREIFKKMLLLERSPGAGEPLLGALIGFRKLIVGNRDYRIIWRETIDDNHNPVLEIAEFWAAGARSDGEVYDEMARRIEQLKESGSPQAHSLATILESMGQSFHQITALPEPDIPTPLPSWLATALQKELGYSLSKISKLSEEDAQGLLMAHWSRHQDNP